MYYAIGMYLNVHKNISKFAINFDCDDYEIKYRGSLTFCRIE